MTNKPMLNVELRALLERLLSHDFAEECQECGIGYSDAWEELRALLDEPDEPFNLQGWSIDHSAGRPILMHNKCSVIEAEQAYGLLNLIETAAQHQGGVTLEQVLNAYDYANSHPHKYLRGTTNWCAAVAHALNVQQPAPVAVDPEMLERFPEINFANYGQDEVEALQAWAFEAYEAIARLNGVKP